MIRNRWTRRFVIPAALASFVLLGACEVTNPGPVQDEFLGPSESQAGLINGIKRRMAEYVGYGTYSMALLSREIFPGGQIGAFGHDVVVQGGYLTPGEDLGYWGEAQQARFIGETAIKRFTEAGASSAMMFQAHVWTGYAYRVMGEWWCDAVIGSTDPADSEPGAYEQGTDTYFQRAIDNFNAALTYAASGAETDAARMGLAQAYAGLGDWSNAASNAAMVPDAAEFFVEYDALEDDYYNTLFWANNWTPYASYSMDYTWAKEQYEADGDPRIEVVEDPTHPLAVGSLSGHGPVPWSNQNKYTDAGADQRLASGWEMRLIEAEAILQQGGAFADAMTLINHVRTRADVAMPSATAASTEEAWTALKHERAVELFLEGRRLYDERRWQSDGSGGTIDVSSTDWNTLSPIFSQNPRSYCLDIPDSERDTNPNVPPIGG